MIFTLYKYNDTISLNNASCMMLDAFDCSEKCSIPQKEKRNRYGHTLY